MGKRFINSTIFSVVVSIVITVGSYTCKGSSAPSTQMVVVQHPDSCFLLKPAPLASGLSAGGDIVNVPPGPTQFEFDCNGSDVKVTKTVEDGEMTVRIDPMQR